MMITSRPQLINSGKILRTLTSQQIKRFAFIHNFHHPPVFYVNDVKYTNDYDISDYEPVVQAFLTRRWITKREVYPKLEILPVMENYRNSLYLQKLVPMDRLLAENHMVKMVTSYKLNLGLGSSQKLMNANINSQYFMSIICEEYEKNLYEAYMKKVLMNGQVVSIGDYNDYVKIKEKADEIFDIFYNGEKLTEFERDIERRYLSLKSDKLNKYERNKTKRYKVNWTLSDINRYQEQENYRMTDPEFLSKPRPIYAKFDLDESLKQLYTYMDIKNTGWLRRKIAWLTEMKIFEQSRHRTKLQAKVLLAKIFQYPDCWEFVNQLEVEEDFHINHSIVNMHIWLVATRLQDFVEYKFADDMKHELIDCFNAFTRKEIYDLDIMRKEKKIESIENYLYAIRKNFDHHFYINAKTVDNPYFKIDALVWSCIYHEKVPRYSDKVYKMSEYLIRSFNYIKTLSYHDIETGNIDWNACRIPVNYKDRVLKYNIPLSEYEFKREMNSSYKVKKYHYDYRWPIEITEDNLVKTFLNMKIRDMMYRKTKSVSEEKNKIDAMSEKEKQELSFLIKQKIDEDGKLAIHKEELFYDPKTKTKSLLGLQFDAFRKNMFLPLDGQLKEQYERKVKREEVEKNMKADENNVFDIDKTPENIANLDQYKDALKEAKLNQKKLRETMTPDQLSKKEKLRRRQEELDKFGKGESADMSVLKKSRLSKFKPPPKEQTDADDVDDHVQIESGRKKKFIWF